MRVNTLRCRSADDPDVEIEPNHDEQLADDRREQEAPGDEFITRCGGRITSGSRGTAGEGARGRFHARQQMLEP